MERQYLQGVSVREIAGVCAVSEKQLRNHCAQHISDRVVATWEKKELAGITNILEGIQDIFEKCKLLFDRNYAKKRDSMALKALSEQRKIFDLIARIMKDKKELELAERKQESDRERMERDAEFANQLKILTTPELFMYQRLTNKIEYQTKEIIIPEKSGLGEYIDPIPQRTITPSKPRNARYKRATMARTK